MKNLNTDYFLLTRKQAFLSLTRFGIRMNQKQVKHFKHVHELSALTAVSETEPACLVAFEYDPQSCLAFVSWSTFSDMQLQSFSLWLCSDVDRLYLWPVQECSCVWEGGNFETCDSDMMTYSCLRTWRKKGRRLAWEVFCFWHFLKVFFRGKRYISWEAD